MKYRVKEIKKANGAHLFYPQFKGTFFWWDIGSQFFSSSIFNKVKDFTENRPYVFDYSTAKDIIVEYDKFFGEEYDKVKIHNVVLPTKNGSGGQQAV